MADTYTIYDTLGNKIKLGTNEFISEGGEGKVFIKNNMIYKIYHEASKALSIQKIQELSVLQKPNIFNPISPIYNEHRLPIGYIMHYADNTVALPRIFTTSFRTRNQITPDMSISLVNKMMETIQYIHEKDILLVDGNEYNYLVNGKNFTDPYFIDVDSYQTSSYPATVIMPSIRDWQAKKWTKETDWFSFGIIATEIFLGIHPFKGVHPDYENLPSADRLKERVLHNVSIFNKKTQVPDSCRPFNLIPTEFVSWFEQIFEQGKRIAPPQLTTKIISKAQTTHFHNSSAKLIISNLFEAESEILGVTYINGHQIIYIDGAVYLDKHKYVLESKSAGIIYHNNIPFEVDIKDSCLFICNFKNKEVICENTIAAKAKVIIDNRVYVCSEGKFSEIKISDFGKTVATVGNTWSIMPNATKLYREILIQNILGKTYITFPPASGMCQTIAISEFDSIKIIDAKYEDGVMSVLAFDAGNYDRLTITFNTDFSKYEIRIEKDVSVYGINFASLPNGIYAALDENGNLSIGGRKTSSVNVLKDSGIKADSVLCHDGTTVCYYLDNTVYSIRMK